MITMYKIVEKQISAIGNYLPFEINLEDIYKTVWTKIDTPEIKNCSSITDINGNKLFNNALYLNGSSALYTDIELGGKDFTISFWVCPTEDKEDNYIFVLYTSPWIAIEYINNNFLIRSEDNFTGNNIVTDKNLFNMWNHIALCYNHNESNIYVYLNGKFTQNYNYSLQNSNNKFYIGSSVSPDSTFFTGYIKNFQIYNGIMRWSGNNINLTETYYTSDLNYIKKEYDIDYTYNYNINTKKYINKKINSDYINIRNIIKKDKFNITNTKKCINKNIINEFNNKRCIILNILNKNISITYFCKDVNILYNNFIRKIRKKQKFKFNHTKRYLARKMTFKNFKINRTVEWTRLIIGYILNPNIYNK